MGIIGHVSGVFIPLSLGRGSRAQAVVTLLCLVILVVVVVVVEVSSGGAFEMLLVVVFATVMPRIFIVLSPVVTFMSLTDTAAGYRPFFEHCVSVHFSKGV